MMAKNIRGGSSTIAWIVIGGALVVLFLLLAQGARLSNLDMTNTSSVLGISAEEKLFDELTENPQGFIGQNVTVQGEVENVISENAFVIDAPGLANDKLLVITRNPFNVPEMEGQDAKIDGEVRVSGTVREFQVVDVADSLDINLEPDAVIVFEGQPYLLADTLMLLADLKNFRLRAWK